MKFVKTFIAPVLLPPLTCCTSCSHSLSTQGKDVMASSNVPAYMCVCRFDKSFRRLIRSVLKLGMNDEKEEVDLSGLLVMGGEVKGVCPPLTEEELEQWFIILRGVVEVGEGREGDGCKGGVVRKGRGEHTGEQSK